MPARSRRHRGNKNDFGGLESWIRCVAVVVVVVVVVAVGVAVAVAVGVVVIERGGAEMVPDLCILTCVSCRSLLVPMCRSLEPSSARPCRMKSLSRQTSEDARALFGSWLRHALFVGWVGFDKQCRMWYNSN